MIWDAICKCVRAICSALFVVCLNCVAHASSELTHVCNNADKYSVLLLVYFRICCGKLKGQQGKEEEGDSSMAVSYTHLTLPTTPYV